MLGAYPLTHPLLLIDVASVSRMNLSRLLPPQTFHNIGIVRKRVGAGVPRGLLSIRGKSGSLFSTGRARMDYTKHSMPTNGLSRPGGPDGASSPKKRKTAYIALGSNLGDRIGWIERACNEMDARGIRVKRTSSLWETEPMYVLEQDSFVNGACEVRCLPPSFPLRPPTREARSKPSWSP